VILFDAAYGSLIRAACRIRFRNSARARLCELNSAAFSKDGGFTGTAVRSRSSEPCGWIVRRAKINHVHVLLRRIGNETIRRFAWQINELRVSARFVRLARVTGHDIRVHVNGINRVTDGDFIFPPRIVEDRTAITLRAVADKISSSAISIPRSRKSFLAMAHAAIRSPAPAVAFERLARGHSSTALCIAR